MDRKGEGEVSDWEELGVIKAGLDAGWQPVVARVSVHRTNGELSYEFGVLRSGKVELLRYWRADRLYNLGTLLKVATSLSMTSTLTGSRMTPSLFRKVIERTDGLLLLVDEHMTGEQERETKGQKKFGASIGELVALKGKP